MNHKMGLDVIEDLKERAAEASANKVNKIIKMLSYTKIDDLLYKETKYGKQPFSFLGIVGSKVYLFQGNRQQTVSKGETIFDYEEKIKKRPVSDLFNFKNPYAEVRMKDG